ncbi:hypothetical protein RKD47_002396 [Streptomyces albogriseolus]
MTTSTPIPNHACQGLAPPVSSSVTAPSRSSSPEEP